MSNTFAPKLAILPKPQRLLWQELRVIPDAFVLCGGTAIALQLGHRSSIDFDFIASSAFDPDTLFDQIAFLRDGTTLQKSASTLTCSVDRGGPVQLSFFGTPSVRLIESPRIAPDNGLRIASLTDLAGMKAAVVQKRAEAKDYLDLDALLTSGAVDLPAALGAARALYGQSFNPELTLKSLCFFGDGNLSTLPRETQDRLVAAVRAVDLNRIPSFRATD